MDEQKDQEIENEETKQAAESTEEQKQVQDQPEAEAAKAEEVTEEVVAEDNASNDDSNDDDSSDDDSNDDKSEKASKDKKQFKKKSFRQRQSDPADSEFMEKVISIDRITKVTKGGKKLSFRALVVVGDMKGNVGYSLSKAAEVATAIKKAMATAKKNMIAVPMYQATIPHEIIGECSGSRVLLKPACKGTGVIAAGPVRAVCDGAGIHNILSKCHRSNNPINVVKATIDGLSRLKTSKLPQSAAQVAETKEAEVATVE